MQRQGTVPEAPARGRSQDRRPATSPARAATRTPGPLPNLQGLVGNRVLDRLVQAKLRVSQPGDAHEQEADRVAELVTGTQAPQAAGAPDISPAPRPNVQRACAKCEEEEEGKVHRKAAGPAAAPPQSARAEGPAHAAESLTRLGGGHPLPPSLRADFEPRFGYDFRDVRVHTDAEAAEAARSVDALAFTVGRDVVFGAGQFSPDTEGGRRLLAHELTHVVQQAAAGTSIQRQPAGGAAYESDKELDSIFETLEKEGPKKIGPKSRELLRKWAVEYAEKTGQKADLDVMRYAWSHLRTFGKLREIKSVAEVEAAKLKPPIPCNEIIPYKVGTKLLVTHLLDKVVPSDRLDFLKNYAAKKEAEAKEGKKSEGTPARDLEDIIRTHPTAIFDLIMSEDVPKSATAEITKSGPELVEAKVAVPAIPAKGGLPAYEPFTATMTLEFDTGRGGYNLLFTRATAEGQTLDFMMSGLQMSKVGDGIQVSVGKDEYFKVKVARGADGNLKLQVFEIHTLAKLLLGLDDPLTLINVAPTGDRPAEVAQQEKAVRSEYKPPPKVDRPELFTGTGLQWTDRPAALFSLGWKFTFSPGAGLLQVPLVFQLDYAPRADFFAQAHTGMKFTTPTAVPVTVSVIGGARAGSIETEGPEGARGPRVPVGGPVWGAGVGVRLAPPVELQLDTSLMLNLFRAGTEQGPTWIPTTGLKANFKF